MTERFVSVDVSEFDREPEPEAGRTPEPWVPVPVTEAAAESPAILPAYGRGLIYDSGAMTPSFPASLASARACSSRP